MKPKREAEGMQAGEFTEIVRHAVAEEIAPLVKRVDVLEGSVAGWANEQAKIAAAVTNVASAASTAANLALEAKQESKQIEARVTDACAKMIESALTIHRTSMKEEMAECVGDALKPFKENDAAQNQAIVVLAREFQCVEKLDEGLVKSVPPPPKDEKRGALARIESRVRGSAIFNLLLAASVIARILYEIFGPHR